MSRSETLETEYSLSHVKIFFPQNLLLFISFFGRNGFKGKIHPNLVSFFRFSQCNVKLLTFFKVLAKSVFAKKILRA